MKNTIISKISREKLYKKIYDADSRNSIENVLIKEQSREGYYKPLAKMLTLICIDGKGGM